MLHNYLRGAIADLESLIELTQADVADIKEAKHDEVFLRNDQKQPLIISFENKKNMAQQEILAIKSQNPDSDLNALLDDEASELLGVMRARLEDLKEVNSSYARMVFAVSEFYSSLMQRIFPHEITGYGAPKRSQSTFLRVEA